MCFYVCFRADADDLGQLLASDKPQSVILPHDEAETIVVPETPDNEEPGQPILIPSDDNQLSSNGEYLDIV